MEYTAMKAETRITVDDPIIATNRGGRQLLAIRLVIRMRAAKSRGP